MRVSWIHVACTVGACLLVAGPFVSRAGGQAGTDRIKVEKKYDAEFDAWSKEWLDLDIDGARTSWNRVLRDRDHDLGLRSRALTRFVQLGRLTGTWKELADVCRALAAEKVTNARQRMALMNFVRSVERNRNIVDATMKRLFAAYDKARAEAKDATGRARARKTLFDRLHLAASGARRPMASLLVDPARWPQRTVVLRSNADRGVPRDLLSRTERLENLQREIDNLRKTAPDSQRLQRVIASHARLRTDLRTRAIRLTRSFRIEIRDFEREGNDQAAESLVDMVVDLERVLWPQGRRRLSRRQALRDPFARRGELRRLRKHVEDRLEMTRGNDPAHAMRLDEWLTQVKELMRTRKWAEAATMTIDELQADPFFFPR